MGGPNWHRVIIEPASPSLSYQFCITAWYKVATVTIPVKILKAAVVVMG